LLIDTIIVPLVFIHSLLIHNFIFFTFQSLGLKEEKKRESLDFYWGERKSLLALFPAKKKFGVSVNGFYSMKEVPLGYSLPLTLYRRVDMRLVGFFLIQVDFEFLIDIWVIWVHNILFSQYFTLKSVQIDWLKNNLTILLSDTVKFSFFMRSQTLFIMLASTFLCKPSWICFLFYKKKLFDY